jgi:arylsulfatase A-like enzyme
LNQGAVVNFLVIMNDTLRPDHLAAYGTRHCATPTSQAFAADAAVFDRAYVGSFPTIPNRTDLFTGRFGEPIHPWLPLSYDALTLPEIFGYNGYVTQLVCDTPHLIQGGHNFDFPFHAWQFIRGQEVDRFGMDNAPLTFPFADYSKMTPFKLNRFEPQFCRNRRERRTELDWPTARTYQSAIDWLERNAGHEKFFLWIDSFDPHPPLDPPPEYVDMYDPGYSGDRFSEGIIDSEQMTEAEIHNLHARYAGSVTFLDRWVGKLLAALHRLRLAEKTCVVWVSDHGCFLNEHGYFMGKNCEYDVTANIVWMIRVPGGLGAGQRFAQLVQPADLAPTLLELAGISAPPTMQGRSFLPALRGESFEPRPAAISSHEMLNREIMTKSVPLVVRDGRWVLVDFPTADQRRLYDVQTEPAQQTNVLKEFPSEAERLHEAALQFLRTHEAQPALRRLFEYGEPGSMGDYHFTRSGFAGFRYYFFNCRNEHIVFEKPAD